MRRYQPKSIAMITALLFTFGVLAMPVVAQTGSPGFGSQGQQQQQPQIDPDSQEFDRFVEALEDVQAVQEEVNEEVSEIISESSLSEERFNEIYRATQSPDMAVEDEASEEEQSAFEEVFEDISAVQSDSQSRMVEAVEENNLEVSRFNEIITAVRGNPELQGTLQERME